MTKTLRSDLDLAASLLAGALAHGGSTVSPYTNSTEVTSGYMVGGVHTLAIPMDQVSSDKVTAWAANVLSSIDDAYVGSWVGDGSLWLDVSVNLPSFSDALKLAVERGELAIWDVANGEEVRI